MLGIVIEYHEVLTDEHLLEGVWQLLCRYDHDFVPPLSARENTNQSKLTGQLIAAVEPRQYYENLKKQSFLVAMVQGETAGFMSFRPHEVCADLNDDVDTIYITTIIVNEAYRGRGITSQFYSEIWQLAQQRNQPITTRTWSTNSSHIHVLSKAGLQEIKRIENGRGQGIDTVYYRKSIKGAAQSQ